MSDSTSLEFVMFRSATWSGEFEYSLDTRPQFKISSYSELHGALGTPTPAAPTPILAGDMPTTVYIDEPPELAMYTIGGHADASAAAATKESCRDACKTQRRSRHHASAIVGDEHQQAHYGGEVQLFYAYEIAGEETEDSPRTSVENTISPSELGDQAIEDQDQDQDEYDEHVEHVEVCTITEDGTVSSHVLSSEDAFRDSESPEPSDSEVFTPETTPVVIVTSEGRAASADGNVSVRKAAATSRRSRSMPSKSVKGQVLGKTPTLGSNTRRGTKKREPRKNTTPLACFFCRGRKIRCGGPDEKAEGGACEQCTHRKLECIFPVKSNRGRRPKKPVKAPADEGGV